MAAGKAADDEADPTARRRIRRRSPRKTTISLHICGKARAAENGTSRTKWL